MRKLYVALTVLLASPALANDALDTNTLLIENDAGAVTQVKGLTQRECDAISVLLAPRRSNQQFYTVSSASTVLYGTVTTASKPSSSALTSAKCVVPASP